MNLRISVDLNCDLGEGAGCDEQLMPWISSANIACGGHAGGVDVMRLTLSLARQHGVAIGAHPGLVDAGGFGRREGWVSPEECYRQTLEQTRRLRRLAGEAGMVLAHVKPHGALYHWACDDPTHARALTEAVREAQPGLQLYARAGSSLVAVGRACGFDVVEEAFADRGYLGDGRLVPRSQAGALITDPAQAVRQVLSLVLEGRVKTVDGTCLRLRADTLCVHGDGPRAVAMVRGIREALEAAGVRVVPKTKVPSPMNEERQLPPNKREL